MVDGVAGDFDGGAGGDGFAGEDGAWGGEAGEGGDDAVGEAEGFFEAGVEVGEFL